MEQYGRFLRGQMILIIIQLEDPKGEKKEIREIERRERKEKRQLGRWNRSSRRDGEMERWRDGEILQKKGKGKRTSSRQR